MPAFGQSFLGGQQAGQDLAIKGAAVEQARQQAETAKRQEGLAPIVNAFRYIKSGATPEEQEARLGNVKKWALTQFPNAGDTINGITVDLIEPIYASLTDPESQLKQDKIGADIGLIGAKTQDIGIDNSRADWKTGADISNANQGTALYGANIYDQIAKRRDGNLPAPVATGPDGQPMAAPANFDDEAKLRGEYIKATDEFTKIGDAYSNIRSAAKTPSAAGDMSLIFGFMKMLDPGSVVREGEFANAQNTAGVPDQVRNMYNRALTGERLNEQQRADFVNQSKLIYDNANSRFSAIGEQYKGLAGSYRMDPNRIVIDRRAPGAIDAPTSAAADPYADVDAIVGIP